ncbi:MAG: hypothetical protein H0A75_02485 [Candidatus Methanofishera endochildressiae]|uniref:Uncharacterized protein n=1 Tax=Candidatus Methanofishera endochildressiae TaxID=2738884 RepID=A0A7Z0MMY9_9GAMM|nr:hypothetical protein [Candidatus Methanofishera endochildressiae]
MNLDLIFSEAYYEGLEGGILEAFAKLFPDNTRLYIYPYKSPEQDDLVTIDNFQPKKLRHLYEHCKDNGYLVGLENVDKTMLDINPAKVLSDIGKGRGKWEEQVPESISKIIINKNCFPGKIINCIRAIIFIALNFPF